MFERLFKLSEHGTSVRTEVIAGLTTFLTMSYIIFVNPDILSTTGMDRDAVFVATCLAAALGSMVMATVANWPIGMAPGMGLNAFFAFTVVAALGFTWQQALGAVFISGVIFVILTVTGVRSWLIEGIPHSLRSAIAAGIGLFLGLELVTDRETLEPATDAAAHVMNRLRDMRILVGREGPADNILKIRPPLTVGADDVEMILDRLKICLREVEAAR